MTNFIRPSTIIYLLPAMLEHLITKKRIIPKYVDYVWTGQVPDGANPNIPPPTDFRNITVNLTKVKPINRNNGNQFAFNHDATRILVPQVFSSTCYYCKLELDGTYTEIGTVNAMFGAVGGDDLSVVTSFINNGTNLTRASYALNTETGTSSFIAARTQLEFCDNLIVSSSGLLSFDKDGVYKLDIVGKAYNKIIDVGKRYIRGAVYSEDEKTIVTFEQSPLRFTRYELIDNAWVKKSSKAMSVSYFFANTYYRGLEAGFNYDLSTIVLPTTFGVWVFKFNIHTREYDQVQQLSTSVQTEDNSVSMDRSGSIISFTNMLTSISPVFKLGPDGIYRKVEEFIGAASAGKFSHKVRVSPNGRMLGVDDLYTPQLTLYTVY